MFAQKKKKPKIWLAVPVLLALGAGLWLNAGLEEGADGGDQEGKSIPAASDQYEEDISDLANLPDTSADPDSSDVSEGIYDARSQTADEEGYRPDSEDRENSSGYDSSYPGDFGLEEDQQQDISKNENDPQNQNSSEMDDDKKKYAGKILVIADKKGGISVFRHDKNGTVISGEETTIDLSMLTQTDQKLFQKGILLNNDEELSELLQDFEG